MTSRPPFMKDIQSLPSALLMLKILSSTISTHIPERKCERKSKPMRFQKESKVAASGLRGTYLIYNSMSGNHKKCWQARITVNKKSISLGYFATKEEASEAYQRKRLEITGDQYREL